MFIVPVETETLTAEFCDAPTPVFMFRPCRPAKFWNAEPETLRLLLTALPLPPAPPEAVPPEVGVLPEVPEVEAVPPEPAGTLYDTVLPVT